MKPSTGGSTPVRKPTPPRGIARKRTRLLVVFLVAAPAVLAGCLLLGASGVGWPDMATRAGRAILNLRVNRVLCGFLVGAALSCAGLILQAVLRNPLAEPYVLGVSSGAGLGAAAAILSGLGAASLFALPLCAFGGGAVTIIIVYTLACSGGKPSVYGLILSGVIVSSICSSLLMFLVATAPVEGLHSVMWWMLGSLQPASRVTLAGTGAIIAIVFSATWILSRDLNALALGDEVAHHIGVRTRVIVPVVLGVATLATGAAVSMAGLIGFVGLIVPHVTRGVFGADHRRLVPAAAVGGGVFLAVCDALARTLMSPVEIPVGVVTALFGGPFFLAILTRKRRQGWLA